MPNPLPLRKISEIHTPFWFGSKIMRAAAENRVASYCGAETKRIVDSLAMTRDSSSYIRGSALLLI